MAKNAQKTGNRNNNAPKSPEQMTVEEMRSAVPGNDAGELSADGADMDQTSDAERAERAAAEAEAAEYQRAKNLRAHWTNALVPVLRRNLLSATLNVGAVKKATEAALKTPEIQAVIMTAILPELETLYFGDGAEAEPDLTFRGELDSFSKSEVERLEKLRRARAELDAELAAYETPAAMPQASARPGRPAAASKSSTGRTLNKDGTPRKRRGEGGTNASFSDSEIQLMTSRILPALRGKKLNGRKLNDALGVSTPNEKALIKATLATLIAKGTVRHNKLAEDGSIAAGLAQTYEWTGPAGASAN